MKKNYNLLFSLSLFFVMFLQMQTTAQVRNESVINSQILELKNEYLLEKEFVSCSKVNFSLLGISLVGYNIIISLFLLILSLLKLRKN